MENSGISLSILLPTSFSVSIHDEKKEPFRQVSAVSDSSRQAVSAVHNQQIGDCPDSMVSEETRPWEMELAKIK